VETKAITVRGTRSGGPSPQATSQDTKLRQLGQLYDLRQRAALSAQEFEREKQKILLA
jgi:hypothetical protein